jgi:hypothetical protein
MQILVLVAEQNSSYSIIDIWNYERRPGLVGFFKARVTVPNMDCSVFKSRIVVKGLKATRSASGVMKIMTKR